MRTPEEIFAQEMDRLQKEGSKLLEEEQLLMKQQLSSDFSTISQSQHNDWDSAKYRIKIKWNSSKNDQDNGGYNEDNLNRFLQKYGDINVLVMSPKKKGSALVEFRQQNAAEMAVLYEKGNVENPLTLEWVGSAPENKKKRTTATIKESDYESLVLRQLRQAEERKRLIEKMMQEELSAEQQD